ncbi:hypothetical protein J2Y41_001326 [Arthrobacter sp. 1088]|uniref:hypothetical protein n=1 Tax=Arthrobacter sp. 1088 TaxID=2817768 RepID=UPI00285CEABF|nr:hypothetical protein [Arthrobacter sp. 1088]MDR6685771.1 hypothetical protein [Arthrobacter sp. 1088]
MQLHGRLENIDDGDITFSDDLATVESGFNNHKAIDGYIAATGLYAPPQPADPEAGWLP